MTRITFAIATVLSWAFTPLAALDKATGGGEIVILDLVATERMSVGKLDSCELTYLIAYEDYIYRNGAITLLRGSMNFAGFTSASDKGPAYLFKVTAFDVVGNQPYLAPLKYAYLSSKSSSYAGKEYVIGAAEDGGLLVGYDAFAHFGLIFTDPISLNITREGGNSDVSIPIDLMTYNQVTSLQHTECVLKLIDVLRDKFN